MIRKIEIDIEELYANEKNLLLQKSIAERFDVDSSGVFKHMKIIFSENDLQEDSVCANYAQTAKVGKEYQTKFYSSDISQINQIRTLTRLRDMLLPKLMRGEVRIEL